MLREAASRLLTIAKLRDAKPDRHPEEAPAGLAEGRPEDELGAVSNDAQQPIREMEQDVMETGEQQAEHQRDYFDFAPEPPPETEGVERPEGEDDPVLFEPVLEALKTVQRPRNSGQPRRSRADLRAVGQAGRHRLYRDDLDDPGLPGCAEHARRSRERRRFGARGQRCPRQAGLDAALGPRPHERGSQARTRAIIGERL